MKIPLNDGSNEGQGAGSRWWGGGGEGREADVLRYGVLRLFRSEDPRAFQFLELAISAFLNFVFQEGMCFAEPLSRAS